MNLKSPFVRVAVKGYLGWKFDTDFIRKIVTDTAKSVESEARTKLENSSGAGFTYARPGGGQYRASAAFALPAKRTGNLARSVLARFSKDKFTGFVGPSSEAFKPKEFYPAFLLYGADRGRKGGVLDPRKGFMAPIARRYRTRFNRELAAAMQKAVQPGPPA